MKNYHVIPQFSFFCLSLFLLCNCIACQAQEHKDQVEGAEMMEAVKERRFPVAEHPYLYLPLIQGQRVGLVVNHTSRTGDEHLVDFLRKQGVDVVKVFAPEHGFRGKASAGEKVADSKYKDSDLEIISLYGSKKKPSAEDMLGIDIMIFDIQDLGVRFYTYISTLAYVMQACADSEVPLIVFDRPNPHDHYIDGPVLREEYSSFVGLHRVPIVYGMTIGEYANMIRGEHWIVGAERLSLKILACPGYHRADRYVPPVAPSPNLPTERSMYLYPSLCLFEGTVVSVGRGTEWPFEIFGHPEFHIGSFSFTPASNEASKFPKLEGLRCTGISLRSYPLQVLHEQDSLKMDYLVNSFRELRLGSEFFLDNLFFDKLAGTDILRKQILDGLSEREIRSSWQQDLAAFDQIRQKYLIYD